MSPPSPLRGAIGTGVYEGEGFPEWEGNLILGGLVTEGLVRLAMEDSP